MPSSTGSTGSTCWRCCGCAAGRARSSSRRRGTGWSATTWTRRSSSRRSPASTGRRPDRGPLLAAVDIAVRGGALPRDRFPPGDSPPGIPRLHDYFGRGKGTTAARLAGAIASGRAVNHETLAKAAHVGYDTAAKIVDYLGPLIRDRHEHDPGLKMTPEVAYRWCGEHARYILSWCRRNGLADVASRNVAM